LHIKELVKFLKKNILIISDNTNDPESLYIPPNIPCAEWVLVLGAAYGDSGLNCSLLIPAKSIYEWSLNHLKNSWTSSLLKQQALEHIVSWTDKKNISDNYVTFLDPIQRKVLQPYSGNLMKDNQYKVWCNECKSMHNNIIDATEYLGRDGTESKSIQIWHCPNNHVIKKINKTYFYS
jgi:hypothetical protein